jgi:hypothetical protein
MTDARNLSDFSTLDSFLAEEGILDETTARASARVEAMMRASVDARWNKLDMARKHHERTLTRASWKAAEEAYRLHDDHRLALEYWLEYRSQKD